MQLDLLVFAFWVHSLAVCKRLDFFMQNSFLTEEEPKNVLSGSGFGSQWFCSKFDP